MLISPVSAMAQDSYQYLVGGGYSDTDSDDAIESNVIFGAFQLYTSPISYRDGPYAEADFLNRQSNFLLSLGSVEFDIDFGAVNPSLDGTILGAGFEYANQSTPFTFGVLYSQAEADDTVFNTNVEINYDVLEFRLGYYINNKSRLGVEYAKAEVELLGNNTSISKSEADTYGVNYQNLIYLANNQFVGFGVDAAYIDNDEDEQNTEFSLAAYYYFNRTAGVGAGIALNSGDDISTEGTTFNVNASFFITPMASIGIEYEQFSADEANNDDETIGLQFAVRF